MRAFLVALGSVLLLALSTMGAACGGGSEELSLEEYFEQLQEFGDELNARGDPGECEFGEDVETATSLEELVSAGQQVFSCALASIERLRQGLQEINPPRDVEELHNEVVDKLGELARLTQKRMTQLEDVGSGAQLALLVEEYAEAFEMLETPCVEWEEIAERNGIQLDMDCEDEESD